MDFREALQAGKIGIGAAGDHWTRLFGQKVLGGHAQGYAEGAIASFSDGVNAPVDKLLVEINPVQAGTGDPSPENIRPISGWTGCTVYRSGADTSTPTTYPITFPTEAGTVYGGELDVTSGVLTVDRAMVDLGSLTWLAATNNAYFYSTGIGSNSEKPAKKAASNATPANMICEQYKTVSRNDLVTGSGDCEIAINSGSTLQLKDARFAEYTPSDFQTAVNGIKIVYELATPLTYHLTPTEVTTLLGVNNIWADTGDVKVWYKKKR